MPITFPYERTTVTHTAQDIDTWAAVTLADDESVTADLRGKSFLVSPALGTNGRERHHHSAEIVIEGAEGEKIDVHMGFAPRDAHLDRVYSTYYYTTNFKNLSPGTITKDYESRYGGRAANWWLIEIKPGIVVKEIKHTYWQCPDDQPKTAWMHQPIKTLEYMGGRMHYSVSYPPNYNSEEDINYPIMFSVGGSGELGDDKKFLGQIDSGCIITKNYKHYTEFPCIHVSIQIPTPPSTFTEPVPDPDTASPYHSSWSRYYDSRGYGAVGLKLLLQQFIDDPDYKIDENRVYLGGMSGGGLFSFEMLKGGRDIFAAVAPISAWAIGQAYQNVQSLTYWDQPYLDGDSLRDRLKKEVLRSRHIPTLVGVGGKDSMKYGSRAFKEVADEIGTNCRYIEIPNGSHGGAVKQVWAKTENVEWLFSHTKTITPDDPFPDNNYTIPLNTREAMMVKLTANNHGYYHVTVDGADFSKHIAEREAIESAINIKSLNPNKDVQYEHRYATDVELESVEVQDAPTSSSSS
jgi:hypothetical protein